MSNAPQIDAFIARWKDTGGSEHANYQLFVIELTELLGLDRPNPATDDDSNDHYRFERPVTFAHTHKRTTGFIDAYLGTGAPPRVHQVTLRQLQDGMTTVHGAQAGWIRSEACLRLDFGPGRLPGMLALGAEDPHQFTPQQGTDLLSFFAGVFERSMRHWLS